ncbi:MAG: hypothetical protein ABII13_04380 [Patescibacteria group bacterium]|nr:hypothetical protein [Patescibacteria group bacterium]MBU2509171.1 hypothetical protein [Patescibacteria group bacterium]
MTKVCVTCDAELAEELRPEGEPEDCPSCGGVGTAQVEVPIIKSDDPEEDLDLDADDDDEDEDEEESW